MVFNSKTNRRRYTGEQPGKRNACGPVDDQPRINHASTAGFVHPSVYIRTILLVRVSGETFRRHVFDALESTRDACLLGELFCPTFPLPLRRAP